MSNTPASGSAKDTYNIPNTSGAELPMTGGSGTNNYAMLGLLLIALAGMGAMLRRRWNH